MNEKKTQLSPGQNTKTERSVHTEVCVMNSAVNTFDTLILGKKGVFVRILAGACSFLNKEKGKVIAGPLKKSTR